MSQLLITPKTKIHELLTAYPSLEPVLIAQSPQFKKLQNPVLRNTVAKVTNLGQAAAIGGLKVEDLVRLLRKEIGQEGVPETADAGTVYNTTKPGWFRKRRIKESIDIREMLDEGNQPVHEVLSAVRRLKPKEILEVIAPFLPAPLIDKATGLGHEHWIREITPSEFRVYFSTSGA